MRLSGFSFRLGKRTRLYFSNPKIRNTKESSPTTEQAEQFPPHITVGGVALRLVVLFITLNNVSNCYWRGDVVPFILSIIWALAASAWLIWYCISTRHAYEAWENARSGQSIKPQTVQQADNPEIAAEISPAEEWQEELDDMAKAERLQAQLDAEAAEHAPKYKTVQILLELDMSAEHQQALKNLKLKIAAQGLHGNLTLHQDDNIVSVSLDDFILGRASTTDALWLNRCFSYIDTLSGIKILGGGLDAYNELRPFMVVVDLSVHSTAPGIPGTRDFNILPAARIWGIRSDSVCYVSSTGTAHHALGSCSIGADWTPMLVCDAAEQGFKPCSKCFN